MLHRPSLHLLVIEQRERMDFDVGRNDELFAGEADTIVGDERERESLLRIAYVHHDFSSRTLKVFEIGALRIELKPAFVNKTYVPFGA